MFLWNWCEDQDKSGQRGCQETYSKILQKIAANYGKYRLFPTCDNSLPKSLYIWSVEYSQTPKTMWNNMFWLDGQKLNFFGLNANKYLAPKPHNTTHDQKNPLLPTMKHGGGIMLSGCLSTAGTRASIRVEGITNSIKYQGILAQKNPKASAETFKMMWNFTFHHDNDPKRTK